MPGWSNVEDIEEKLTFEELVGILKARREDVLRQNKFLANIQGIDLDKQEYDAKYEEMQKRAAIKRAAMAQGLTEEDVDPYNDNASLEALGIEIEGE